MSSLLNTTVLRILATVLRSYDMYESSIPIVKYSELGDIGISSLRVLFLKQISSKVQTGAASYIYMNVSLEKEVGAKKCRERAKGSGFSTYVPSNDTRQRSLSWRIFEISWMWPWNQISTDLHNNETRHSMPFMIHCSCHTCLFSVVHYCPLLDITLSEVFYCQHVPFLCRLSTIV